MRTCDNKLATRKQKNLFLLKRPKWRGNIVFGLLLAAMTACCACGSKPTSTSQNNDVLSGNWQFTMSAPADGSFVGGLQGGFLLQSKGSVAGGAVYSIATPPSQTGGTATVCNSGSAPITGTLDGQNVTITAVAGGQNFVLTGILSSDGSTITGTYESTDGPACGTAQTGLQWSALAVPSISGVVQGSFHSTGSGAVTSLRDQDFSVTGSLVQGPNIGASNATVTGTLTFQDYPCMSTASVNGQISGSSVVLQIITPDGLNVGQIGAQPGNSVQSPVTVSNSAAGVVLQGANGYGVSTKSCKAGNTPGDVGNICLALGSSNTCAQPITLTPAFLSFPAQLLASSPTTQTFTLTNTDPSGSTLNGLQLAFRVVPTGDTSNPSDFDLLPSFTETDNCGPSLGSTFSLGSQQSCTITISFSSQQSCPWVPLASSGGAAPSQCPPFLPARVPSPPAQSAILSVSSPVSADMDKAFAAPVSGVGLSAVQPSVPEVDFGAEALSEASAAQVVSFTNRGLSPVLILPPLGAPGCGNPGQAVLLPRPLTPGSVPGLQVVTSSITPAGTTISYICDIDAVSKTPNFQITADGCSGTLLAPQQSCNLNVVFVPQPGTGLASGLDYFLELNTLQCTSTTTTNCEIDSGRFPVELKANLPSPLRMQPGGGLDFGPQATGSPTAPLTITVFNDPADPNSATVNFTGNIVKGDYQESDNCGFSLPPGGSCTLSVTFKPNVQGFDQGSMTITYNGGQTQIIYFRGTGQ
jgi:hypothetical protein